MTPVTVRTTELQGSALDWAVAQVEGRTTRIYLCPIGDHYAVAAQVLGGDLEHAWMPSLAWDQGGPLIDKYGIALRQSKGVWYAMTSADLGNGERAPWVEFTYRDGVRYGTQSYEVKPRQQRFKGPIALIAACRAIVASKLGDTVQVPQELVQ